MLVGNHELVHVGDEIGVDQVHLVEVPGDELSDVLVAEGNLLRQFCDLHWLFSFSVSNEVKDVLLDIQGLLLHHADYVIRVHLLDLGQAFLGKRIRA